jgi:hypothetical protein
MCFRSSQELEERRDQVSNGVTTESGTSIRKQSNENRFDRTTLREQGEVARTSLTERARRKYRGESSNDVLCVLYCGCLSPSDKHLHRRAPSAPTRTNALTFTLVHLDVKYDLDATLGSRPLHNSTQVAT